MAFLPLAPQRTLQRDLSPLLLPTLSSRFMWPLPRGPRPSRLSPEPRSRSRVVSSFRSRLQCPSLCAAGSLTWQVTASCATCQGSPVCPKAEPSAFPVAAEQVTTNLHHTVWSPEFGRDLTGLSHSVDRAGPCCFQLLEVATSLGCRPLLRVQSRQSSIRRLGAPGPNEPPEFSFALHGRPF